MPLSDYFRADQKLKQITKSIVQMPGEGDADLFSLIASDRMHGCGSYLCPEMCRLDIRKQFLTQWWWMVSHCNRLPREVVSALSQSVGLSLYLLFFSNLNKKVFFISAFVHRNQFSTHLYSCVAHCCSFFRKIHKCSLQTLHLLFMRYFVKLWYLRSCIFFKLWWLTFPFGRAATLIHQ